MKLFDSRTLPLAALLALSIPAPQALAAEPEPEEITNAVLAERLEASNAMLVERMDAGFREARLEREHMRREAQLEREHMRREAQLEHEHMRQEAQRERREAQREREHMRQEAQTRQVFILWILGIIGSVVLFVSGQFFRMQRDLGDIKTDVAVLKRDVAALTEDVRAINEGGSAPQGTHASQGAQAPPPLAGYRVQPERHEEAAFGAVRESGPEPESEDGN